jgi:hypothetical protein
MFFIHINYFHRIDHYLCEEGECEREQFTAAFRTDIDLKGKLFDIVYVRAD